LEAGQSFSVETTLSGRWHLAMIADARARGYRIDFVYVGTSDISINLERIRSRVAAGGHNVPEADVRRRAIRSLEHAPALVAMADYVMVFDNSGSEMLSIIDRENGEICVYRETPPWARQIVEATTRGKST
jgi:predicted ABC-type ATPase